MESDLIKYYYDGNDPVFHSAPCAIILYSPSYGHMGGNDAGIAFTYGMLAAEARGLGTCWIGYVEELLFRNKKMRKSLGIAKGEKPWGVMVVGYPKIKYKNLPPRDSLRIHKLS